MTSNRFAGRVAIVTGGAQGIGGACATRLAADGAIVVIADIAADAATAQVNQIKAEGGQGMFYHTDVSSSEAVDRLFAAVIEKFNRIDILVNNAALVHYPPANVNFLELSDETWKKNIDISLNGAFFCASRAARRMVKQVQGGTAGGGAIINISSGGGSRAHRHLASYDTSKGGLEAMTRAAALDLAPWNIRVNTVVPGNIAVGNQMGGAFAADAAKKTIPLGRSGRPDEIAAAVAFLASDDALYITGTRLFVDGGMDVQLRSPGVDRPIELINKES